MLIIPLNLDSVLLLLHNSKLAYYTKIFLDKFSEKSENLNVIARRGGGGGSKSPPPPPSLNSVNFHFAVFASRFQYQTIVYIYLE